MRQGSRSFFLVFAFFVYRGDWRRKGLTTKIPQPKMPTRMNFLYFGGGGQDGGTKVE